MSAQTPFLVFSGTNSRYLAEKICNSLGCPLGQMNIQHFADGEFSVSYEESIRGRDVFLVQSTFPNSDNLMELLLMIDAAKRASAQGKIFYLMGKSSSGKDSLFKKIKERIPELKNIILYTTRPIPFEFKLSDVLEDDTEQKVIHAFMKPEEIGILVGTVYQSLYDPSFQGTVQCSGAYQYN